MGFFDWLKKKKEQGEEIDGQHVPEAALEELSDGKGEDEDE